jgi:thiol reductant ABC exporter CydD subunit
VKPLDPRLLRQGRAARGFVVATVCIGVVTAVLVVAQAMLIAHILATVFAHHSGLRRMQAPVYALGGVLFARAALGWASDTAAYRAAATVRSQLRGAFLRRAADRGPRWLAAQPTGELTLLATRGLDAVDGYFARYLPQLVLACVVPLIVGARMLWADPWSAVIVACTLPLIPVFMALIGIGTRAQMDRQWRTMSRLSHHFLDVVTGLPTLRIFGRERAQLTTIRRVCDDLRTATMRTLRIAFLSSMALELLSSLSVAVVAVSVGVRLVHGDLPLETALLVLLLAPEVYLPWRRVGAAYHASVEGVTAVGAALDVIDGPHDPRPSRPAASVVVPDLSTARLSFEGVGVRYPGRDTAALTGLDLTIEPGEVVAVVGPSGCGKSTLLSLLLRFVTADAGRITVDGADLAEFDVEAWRRRLAWVGQRPHIFAGTIAENIRLARPDATDAEVADAARAASAYDFVTALPDGFATKVGERGVGLSVGQRQRIAIARAFLRPGALLLLDEPTAALDGETEREVVQALRALTRGRTAILTSHRPALSVHVDRIVRLPAPVERAAGAA